MKVLVEICSVFGNGVNETLDECYVIEDTKENREKVLEDVPEEDTYGREEFINGEKNSCEYDCCDDWDTPSGYNIYIKTYEEKEKEIEEKYEKDLLELKKLFD